MYAYRYVRKLKYRINLFQANLKNVGHYQSSVGIKLMQVVVRNRIVLYCIVLYCIVLHCIVFFS